MRLSFSWYLRALLTLQSAIPHLNHFCSIIPNSSLIPYSPIYDVDPPELPEGWHSFHNRSQATIPVYPGPFGSTVTLPRSLPPHLWVFSTERKYKTKISAHQHVALKAYLALYENGLLNEHLLPLTDDMKPQLDEEVKELLKDIDKRAGMAGVSCQMDPWAPMEEPSVWRSSELVIDGLPILLMFTLSRPMPLSKEDGPTLYRSDCDPLKVEWRPREDIVPTDDVLEQARHYTRRLFWSNGSLVEWDNTDFAHLFLPTVDLDKPVWDERRAWLTELNLQSGRLNANPLMANAAKFGSRFSYPTDLSLISGGPRSAKISSFLRWEFNPISPETEVQLRKTYVRHPDLEITSPLLIVRAMPRRSNFLIPTPPPSSTPSEKPEVLLIPGLSTVALLTKMDAEYASLLPSTIRFLSMAITAESLRENLLANTPLSTLSLDLLLTAITAPVSSEQRNYQRLETLGDTVLKFIVGVQLLAEYPGWHEGYLSRKKDHSVSNVRLAKEALSKGLFRWIIRDRLILRKWRPAYRSTLEVDIVVDESEPAPPEKSKNKQELSTKVLADVVEALIGASYLHGSFELGIECAQMFGLGVPWKTLPQRIDTMLARVRRSGYVPSQITNVEKMLNYEFKHKLLLVEALTHASYQQAVDTRSYERMEFLGDSVLDMVVTDLLYRAPGKKYSPGHIHLRKSAVVNQHFLAFICLRCALSIEAAIPRRGERGHFALADDTQQVYLWQCLLHSSLPILDDQNNTFARYKKGQADIEAALNSDSIFPWAALTRLQAPKFFSDLVESVIGAVYLDSGGDFDVVNRVLRVLGILQVLERIIADNVDVLHPVSRLSFWAHKLDKDIKYDFEKEKGKITCIISVDGEEEIRVGELYRGRASRDEVKFMAAEQAIKKLKLRTGTAILRKKKKKPTN
jgi:endoribonuclease Dicer